MSEKSIAGAVLSVVIGVVGVYFVGVNNTVSWFLIGALAVSVFLTDRSLERDKLCLFSG